MTPAALAESVLQASLPAAREEAGKLYESQARAAIVHFLRECRARGVDPFALVPEAAPIVEVDSPACGLATLEVDSLAHEVEP